MSAAKTVSIASMESRSLRDFSSRALAEIADTHGGLMRMNARNAYAPAAPLKAVGSARTSAAAPGA